jgi:predicted nucleic acid-binding protein
LSFLLDTDVLSQLVKSPPREDVIGWMERQRESDLYLSVITIMEIRAGISSMAPGRRRDAYEHFLTREVMVRFSDRILPVDQRIADECGRLLGENEKRGHHPSATDALLAATASVHGLAIATLNRKHFERLRAKLVEF